MNSHQVFRFVSFSLLYVLSDWTTTTISRNVVAFNPPSLTKPSHRPDSLSSSSSSSPSSSAKPSSSSSWRRPPNFLLFAAIRFDDDPKSSSNAGESNNDAQRNDDDDGDDDDNFDDISLDAFRARKQQRQGEEAPAKSTTQKEEAFDGYALRDVIYQKWGKCYDLDFNRVDSFGFRQLYLNVVPFHLGGRPFRHKTELDYLCHLQAIVEILENYEQLDYVLSQIEETTKKPRAGTSPLVAVPLRLDLTKEQVQAIIGN
jgi:hypothetical protein